jgi:hypothetical protein
MTLIKGFYLNWKVKKTENLHPDLLKNALHSNQQNQHHMQIVFASVLSSSQAKPEVSALRLPLLQTCFPLTPLPVREHFCREVTIPISKKHKNILPFAEESSNLKR